MNTPKNAIPRIIMGPNGKPVVVYVDAQTGQTLSSLEGYNVLSAGNNVQNLDDTNSNQPNDQKTVSEEIIDDTKSLEAIRDRGEKDASQSKGGDPNLGLMSRSVADNYGYIDKPGILGITSMLPGMIGTGSKIANLGINTSNTIANNKARETMGVKSMGGFETLANALGIRDTSKIADVKIDGKPYSVGFEAQNKLGQTTLTPMEARNRALTAGTQVTPLTRDETKAFRKEFKDEYPDAEKSRFGLSNIKNAFNGLIDGLFGGGNSNKDSFPDAPAKNESYNEEADAFSKEQREANLSGLSDRTRDAVENNRGGLF